MHYLLAKSVVERPATAAVVGQGIPGKQGSWLRVRDRLRLEYGATTFDNWLKNIDVASLVGDALVLTKPIGTGVIATAIKKGLDAEFILNISGETKPITSVIQDTVRILEPVCEELGSTENLLSINSMLKKTKVVDEMRKISRDNSLIEVVHFLEEKLISSL